MSKNIDVESWAVERLIPYERNTKKHPEEQIEKLAKSLKEFGWDQPIVVDADGVIIKGHGRRLAALHLGLKKVPVVKRDDLTPEQVKALRIADNKVAETDHDVAMLEQELRELQDVEFDMSDFLNERELEFLMDDLGTISESDISDDLAEEVEEKNKGTSDKLDEEDEKDESLVKIFGFKTMTTRQARSVRMAMAVIEAETGLEGAAALARHAKNVLEKAE